MRLWMPYDAQLLLWEGKEKCGFVVKKGDGQIGFVELHNISSDPEHYFEMDGDDVREVYKFFNVIGLWHSHPPGSPQPSKTDREWHPAHLDMYIISDLAIHRYIHIHSLEYQEVPTPWNV